MNIYFACAEKGFPLQYPSYYPIDLISMLFKVFESILRRMIWKPFKSYYLVSNCLYGSWKEYYTGDLSFLPDFQSFAFWYFGESNTPKSMTVKKFSHHPSYSPFIRIPFVNAASNLPASGVVLVLQVSLKRWTLALLVISPLSPLLNLSNLFLIIDLLPHNYNKHYCSTEKGSYCIFYQSYV